MARLWIGRILLALLVSPLLVELVLQLGALGVALFAPRRDAPVAQGDCAVLCLGDSFTYGLGASGPNTSYPSFLQRELERAPFRGRSGVVNAGWPGSTSREVLQQLVRKAEEVHPAAVAVLVGVNDFWKRPEPLQLDAAGAISDAQDSASWRFELRTVRLVKLLLQPPIAETEPEPEPTAAVLPPPGDPQRQGQGQGRDRAEEALRRHDFEGALALIDSMLAESPDDGALHYRRVVAARGCARDDVVQEELDWLSRRRIQKPSRGATVVLLAALRASGRFEEAGMIAREDVDDYPRDAAVWYSIAAAEQAEGKDAKALESVTRSIEFSKPGDEIRAHAFRLSGALKKAAGDLQGSVTNYAAAWLLDRNDEKLFRVLRQEQVTDAMVETIAVELKLDAEARTRLRKVYADAKAAGSDGASEVLAGHLRALVAFCRSRGIEPLILTYPMESEVAEAAQRRVAQETGAALVDVRARFIEIEKARPHDDLFVADGHCSDLGYEFVAKATAEALGRLGR